MSTSRIALRIAASLGAIALSCSAAAQEASDETPEGTAPKPAAVVADGIPPVPQELVDKTRAYFSYRTAAFRGWDPKTRAALIATRFGDTSQLHRVAAPGAARVQLTFEEEPVSDGSLAPERGDVMVVAKDAGGSEFDQLYRLDANGLTLLTDGKSRNGLGAWAEDGSIMSYSSTQRTGRDNDIWIMDPRDVSTKRLVAELDGGGWFPGGFSPDKSEIYAINYISVNDIDLYRIDVASGNVTPLPGNERQIAYSGFDIAPDGTFWVTSDEGADFKRLGTLDPDTGAFSPVIAEEGDIDGFDISDDGSFIAYAVSSEGRSLLKILTVATGAVREVDLPPGIIGSPQVAPWGEIGFTFISNQAAADMYSVNPETLALTRWTYSESGGIDLSKNALPELVRIESFDGEPMSGFLYRPDPAKFPGKRPLIVDIHGGPEGQSTATFQGRGNYLVNELGIAVFEPNVRGSTGFGKRFVTLDNGPFKREDSLKDIGAFMDALATDPAIDMDRVGVEGGSYGGYMCYASAIRYGERLKGALCVVAISDFVTFLENTEDYRRDLRRVEYGDERDPAQRAKLKEISPLTRASEIDIPLMVATGANDPRVPASEADQMIAAVRANGQEAWHFLAENEGHGFAKKENADYYYWAKLMFWQKHLLGME